MSKKKLNNSDFEDFFSPAKTESKSLDQAKTEPAKENPESKTKKPTVNVAEPEISKKSKRAKALTKSDKYPDKNSFKGVYLTEDLAKKLEGVSGIVNRTHSDLVCESLEKLFSTKKYQEIIDFISKIK